jgi:hypothetical protein
LDYHDIEQSIDKYYDNDDSKYSNEIDILITYLKGQKSLYIHSKYMSQYKLNWIMVPVFLITATLTVFSPFVERYHWSGGFMSALNATTALLLALNNYLRLESATEIFLQLANQYDKLETRLEMASSKLMFLENNEDKVELVLNKITEVEQKMTELKETNRILIPDEVKYIFPIIYHINVFSFIKRVELHKKDLIMKFRDVKNEIRYILYKWKREGNGEGSVKEQSRLRFLYDVKTKIKDEIIEYRNAYGTMDEIFAKEIRMASSNKRSFCWFWVFGRDSDFLSITDFRGLNPVIDKYFDFL